METNARDHAMLAARRVIEHGGRRGRIGAVLGTGLGGVIDQFSDQWSMDATETQWLPKSTATGHAGRLVGGTVCGEDIVVLQGRVHAYEGFAAEDLVRGVQLLAALGVDTLLVTNASGGLRPDMQSGELVVMTDHIDLVRGAWSRSPVREQTPYDAQLVDCAITATRQVNAVARKGVYAYVKGPSYETRAEYRMLRRFGADVVGMSTVPEVLAARSLGLRVAGVSVVTNVARPDASSQIDTDAEEVCEMAHAASDSVWAILQAFTSI